MPPTGNSMGGPRNDEERADASWVREQTANAIAARPAHRTQVQAVGGDWFRAWCSTCSRFVTAKGRDKERQQYLAGAHERAEGRRA